METKEVKISRVNIGQGKPTKNGKTYWPCGLQIESVWYNSLLFSQDDHDKFSSIKEGDKMVLTLFQEEYQGKMYNKFKVPSRLDMLEERVAKLELFAKMMFKKDPDLKQLWKTLK